MASKVIEGRCKDPKVNPSRPTKGWLKLLVTKDDRIVQVTMPGVDEPCYALASNLGIPPQSSRRTYERNYDRHYDRDRNFSSRQKNPPKKTREIQTQTREEGQESDEE
jgi:hypothetical protein